MIYVTIIAIMVTEIAIIISINKISKRLSNAIVALSNLGYSHDAVKDCVKYNQQQIGTLLKARAEISMLKEEVRCLKETVDALIQEVG